MVDTPDPYPVITMSHQMEDSQFIHTHKQLHGGVNI